jgi:hypothetical protein
MTEEVTAPLWFWALVIAVVFGMIYLYFRARRQG